MGLKRSKCCCCPERSNCLYTFPALDISDSALTHQLAAPLAATETDSGAHEAGTISTGNETNREVQGKHHFLPQLHLFNAYFSSQFMCPLSCGYCEQFPESSVQPVCQPARSPRSSCRDAAVAQTPDKQFVPDCNS